MRRISYDRLVERFLQYLDSRFDTPSEFIEKYMSPDQLGTLVDEWASEQDDLHTDGGDYFEYGE